MRMLVAAAAVVVLSCGAFAAGPVSLCGASDELAAIEGYVMRPQRWASVRLPKLLQAAEDLGSSRALYVASAGKGVSANWLGTLRPFLEAGGTLIVAGNAGDLKLDFRKAALDAPVPVRVASVGEGRVYRFKTSLVSFIGEFAKRRQPLGEADEAGAYHPTPAGEAVNAYAACLTKILAAAEPDRKEVMSTWGLTPLGAPGTRKARTSLPNRPVFAKGPREWKPIVPFGDGVICCPTNEAAVSALADELSYHLKEMTGREAPHVTDGPAEAVPAIVFRAGEGPRGESRIRLEGRHLVLSGRGVAELSHALTYLLEAEGCRYLWPGRLGKVIPKNPAFALRAFDWRFTPTYKVRELRGARYQVYKGKLARLGVSDAEHEAYERVRSAAAVDHPGNRGFFEWHGCNDGRDLPGEMLWGHYFGDYDRRFRSEHPEFFALQPDGTRELDLGRWPERPRLCLSCRGLAEQAAKDILAAFRKNPKLYAHPVCLPDGGPGRFCLCEECRRLDPVNGVRRPLYIGAPLFGTFEYVSLTDRVLTFNNRIAELVTAEKPDARLTMYAYSYYVEPPLSVKPHPALVILSCAGNYTTDVSHEAEASIAGWADFGCGLFWRPNSFIGYRTSVPQVLSRHIFDDLELLKVNGVIGVDVCACNEMWANRGFDAYMATKAIVNFDRLEYETYRADWLEKGFGKAAAQVGAYFAELERICEVPRKLTGSALTWVDREKALEKAYDVPRLRALLAAAKDAATDEAVRARIEFLARGLDVAELDLALSFSHRPEDERRYVDTFMSRALADPLVWNPNWYGSTYYGIHLRNVPARKRQK